MAAALGEYEMRAAPLSQTASFRHGAYGLAWYRSRVRNSKCRQTDLADRSMGLHGPILSKRGRKP